MMGPCCLQMGFQTWSPSHLNPGWFRFAWNNTVLMLNHQPCLAESPVCCLLFWTYLLLIFAANINIFTWKIARHKISLAESKNHHFMARSTQDASILGIVGTFKPPWKYGAIILPPGNQTWQVEIPSSLEKKSTIDGRFSWFFHC